MLSHFLNFLILHFPHLYMGLSMLPLELSGEGAGALTAVSPVWSLAQKLLHTAGTAQQHEQKQENSHHSRMWENKPEAFGVPQDIELCVND